jgi:tetratricopeptide (TPR) repeat protein
MPRWSIQRLDTNTENSMTKITSYTAFALLLLSPLFAAAQDEEPGNDDVVIDPLEQTVPVADEEVLPQPTPEPQPEEESEERLLSEFARYRVLLQQGTLDEADIAAKRIVEMAIKVYGPQSRETANALNNLGIVQHGSGQYDAAIQNFTSSIEIIELVADRLNDALVNPLKGLGAAQLGNGRPDQARKTFDRAAHITQVNEGPHNLGQIEILESIAETYIRMGDTKSARNILDRIHIINVKHFEQDPLGLLPSLMSRADWQHRAGYYAEERTTYRRAIRIIETTSGKNDPLLVEPLRRLGESFYFVDISMATTKQQGLVSTGELYFKRAARIAEKSGDMEWRERSKAQVVLADYYVFIDSQNRSRKIYKQVWDQLSEDEEKIAQRTAWFKDPVAIRAEILPTFAGNASPGNPERDDIASGRIVVDYTVSARGRVRDLRTEAFPEEFTDMQRTVHREIRQRVHRPRVVDGVPVNSEDMHFEHDFSYTKADLEALRAAKVEAKEEKEDGGDR